MHYKPYEIKTKKLINNEKKFSKIKKYVALLEEKNKMINLTGFKDNILWKEGIYESILCFKRIKLVKKVLDIGSGAGFPSIPLLIFKPYINLTIIEPKIKRINFLKEVSKKLDLKINFINKRAEEVTKEKFDIITARAVDPLFKLIKISYHLGKINSFFYFIKGKNIEKEIQTSSKIINKFKIQNLNIIKINIDNKQINILKFQKIKNDI